MSEQSTPCYQVTIPGTLAPYSLTIQGRLPGLNEYTDATRRHRQKGAEMKSEWQTVVQWAIRQQLRGLVIDKPVFLIFTWIEKDRRRDRDNVSSFGRKVIQDALVASGVLADDGWDEVTGYLDRYDVDPQNPRIVVQFIEQEGTTCRKRQGKNCKKSRK